MFNEFYSEYHEDLKALAEELQITFDGKGHRGLRLVIEKIFE